MTKMQYVQIPTICNPSGLIEYFERTPALQGFFEVVRSWVLACLDHHADSMISCLDKQQCVVRCMTWHYTSKAGTNYRVTYSFVCKGTAEEIERLAEEDTNCFIVLEPLNCPEAEAQLVFVNNGYPIAMELVYKSAHERRTRELAERTAAGEKNAWVALPSRIEIAERIINPLIEDVVMMMVPLAS